MSTGGSFVNPSSGRSVVRVWKGVIASDPVGAQVPDPVLTIPVTNSVTNRYIVEAELIVSGDGGAFPGNGLGVGINFTGAFFPSDTYFTVEGLNFQVPTAIIPQASVVDFTRYANGSLAKCATDPTPLSVRLKGQVLAASPGNIEIVWGALFPAPPGGFGTSIFQPSYLEVSTAINVGAL